MFRKCYVRMFRIMLYNTIKRPKEQSTLLHKARKSRVLSYGRERQPDGLERQGAEMREKGSKKPLPKEGLGPLCQTISNRTRKLIRSSVL